LAISRETLDIVDTPVEIFMRSPFPPLGVLLSAVAITAASSVFAATPEAAIKASEAARYAADFDAAVAPLKAGLAEQPSDRTRLRLLLQQMRVHQSQRLVGRVSPDEAAVANQVTALKSGADADLRPLNSLRETTSAYFVRLTTGDLKSATQLAPAFTAAAEGLTEPCDKADALFFAGLMPQVAGEVAASAAPLAKARQVAEAGRCDLELSYVLRHEAAVAEEAGDLKTARDLYARSLDLRRAVGFQVFLPYSMLSLADVQARLGAKDDARRLREEAVALSDRLALPNAAKAARDALAGA
jgi:tetratricopeptide (TPR) repeat protein